MELEYDTPTTDHCGSCTACLDACPTEAIVAPYVVDGSKCISYFTIELKENLPNEMKGKFDDWVFGCDVCQDVCPWNRFSKPHNEPLFQTNPEILDYVDLSNIVMVLRKKGHSIIMKPENHKIIQKFKKDMKVSDMLIKNFLNSNE